MASEVATALGIVRQAYQNSVVSGWESNHDLPVEWPNHALRKPEGVLWCRFSIIAGQSFQAEISGSLKRFRNLFIMMVQIFAPADTGTAETDRLVARISDAFRGKKFSNVVFKDVTPTQVGKTEGWWQTNVACPFFFDDLA